METLTDILKIGGPAAVAVVMLGYVAKQLLEVVSNHIKHNTEVLQQVSERTREDTEATRENTRVLQELKEYLLKLNGKNK